MADTPKNPQPGGRKAETPKQRPAQATATTPPARPVTRRAAARRLREERRQRQVIIATGVAIGLALLAVLGGVIYDQLWLPSRPVAQVGDTSLSRRDYWAERREAYIREIVQNFQLLALFGGNQQFSQQFQGQSANIQNQIANVRSAEVEDAIVTQWQDRQLKLQGASSLGLSVSDDEISQALANDLGQIFLPPPTPPVTTTATAAPAGSPEASPEASAEASPEAAETPAPTGTAEPTATATPGGPTATPAPTETPEPTATPQPTPDAATAATQVDQILSEIFRRYELEVASAGATPSLTREDFRQALTVQYREQALNAKIQAALVPDEGFVASEEPERVRARQILVAVETAEGADQATVDAAFAEARAEADEILAELQGGADFVTLAQERSDDPGSREQGGDLGSFDINGAADNGATYPPELVSAAFALAEEELSEPIRTQFGWHILLVTERQVPSREDQLRDARTEALDTWLEEQRTAIGAQRFPEPTPTANAETAEPITTAVPTFLPGPPTPEPSPTPEPTLQAEPTAEAETTPEPTPTP